MQIVKLTTDLLRLALGYEDGSVILPCVDPETVEEVERIRKGK